MEKPAEELRLDNWRKQVQTIGFRGAVIALLKDHVSTIEDRNKLKTTIKRLRKYEPDLEIIRELLKNPHWKSTVEDIIDNLPHTNAEPEILFVFRGGGNVPTIPAMDEKKVYFSSGDTLYAIDGVTGQVAWRKKNPHKTWYPVFLEGEALYATSGKTLVALNKNTGNVLWVFRSEKHLTAPFSSNGQVYVGSHEGTLFSLNSRTGQRLWSFNVPKRIDIGNDSWNDLVFAVSEEGIVYGIRTNDGECLWQFRISSKVGSIPAVKDGLVVFGAEDHKIYALLANSGQLLWEFTSGGKVYATPCIYDDVVYCGSRDRHLYALDIDTGEEIWRIRTLGYVSSPAVSGGMVYFSAQGRIYSVNAESYKMRWCFPLGFSVATPPVIKGRRLYTGTQGGQMLCLRLIERLTEHTAARVIKEFLGG